MFLALPRETFLVSLSRQLIDYENFLVGYLGYTIEEIAVTLYLRQDYKTCVLKMLSLWRCKDGQGAVKNIEELLLALKDALQIGPYKSLMTVIESMCCIAYNYNNAEEYILVVVNTSKYMQYYVQILQLYK